MKTLNFHCNKPWEAYSLPKFTKMCSILTACCLIKIWICTRWGTHSLYCHSPHHLHFRHFFVTSYVPVDPRVCNIWSSGKVNWTDWNIALEPDAKSQFIGKDPDAAKDWRQEEKGATEDEMVGWHHWLNGYELEQTPGDGEGQGKLGMLQSMGLQRVRCDSMTEQQQQ